MPSSVWDRAGGNVEAQQKLKDFEAKQKMPYRFKVKYAEIRAREFVKECEKRGMSYYVSVGGLDSITLLMFLRSIGIDCPAVSVSLLEDGSIQKIHKKLGVVGLRPSVRSVDENGIEHRWTKTEIIQEFGFPVISKLIAERIEYLQNPTPRNEGYRHSMLTGETKAKRISKRIKIPNKWLELFGGYANEYAGTNYKTPPFKVSSKCCYYLKEKPCDDWAKEHNSAVFVGLMASEGGRRELHLKLNGCNYFGKTTTRSAPFAIFSRQDLLQLALDLNVPVPEIYGTIERKEDGTLYTTKAQRTGCGMCGFGIHLQKRPHGFDLLKERNPRAWQYWMYECCTDADGNKYGWARVLDYIGVEYLNEEKTADERIRQGLLFKEE